MPDSASYFKLIPEPSLNFKFGVFALLGTRVMVRGNPLMMSCAEANVIAATMRVMVKNVFFPENKRGLTVIFFEVVVFDIKNTFSSIDKNETNKKLLILMRREWDSNPRYPFGVYTLSRRAPSATRTSLRNFQFPN